MQIEGSILVKAPVGEAGNHEVKLPASKSVSNRALILSALYHLDTELENVAECDDTNAIEQALRTEEGTVNVGAAGTAMRFLTAYYAVQEGRETVLDGSQRMRIRPIAPLVSALRECGADIQYLANEGFPPLKIKGKKLEVPRGYAEIEGNVSSQFVSAMVMIAPLFCKEVRIKGALTSEPYLRMTVAMMNQMGIACTFDGAVVRFGVRKDAPNKYYVEPDWSAAGYWWEMKNLLPEMNVKLAGLDAHHTLQGDVRGVEILERLRDCERLDENLGDVPDMAQTIAVTACAMRKPFVLKGLHTLRVKETDRLTALVSELAKLGFKVESNGIDTLSYDGNRGQYQAPARIATYKDHRMAMAFAPLSAIEPQGIIIEDAAVVSKSYPEYWNHLQKVGFRLSKTE